MLIERNPLTLIYRSICMAIVPWKPSGWEFIVSEVMKGIAMGMVSIEDLYQRRLQQLAIVPYTRPKSAQEFIDLEVKQGLTLGIITPEFMLFQRLQIAMQKHAKVKRQRVLEIAKPCTIKNHMPSVTSLHSWRFHLKLSGLMHDENPYFLRKHASSHPQLNGEEIAEALQSELAITIATDKKPIVASYGAGPCVIVGGYEAINKIAFIVHFSHEGEVRTNGHCIFYNTSKLAKERITKPLQIHLRGGVEETTSEATVKAIRIWMTARKDIPMESASEEILGNGFGGGKSLSIDSRNGTVSEYDPLASPQYRKMDELANLAALMSTYMPNISLAYAPKV